MGLLLQRLLFSCRPKPWASAPYPTLTPHPNFRVQLFGGSYAYNGPQRAFCCNTSLHCPKVRAFKPWALHPARTSTLPQTLTCMSSGNYNYYASNQWVPCCSASFTDPRCPNLWA